MGESKATRRQLDFHSFDEVLADVDRLHRGGYAKAGNWALGQICDHLGYFMEAGLTGAQFRVPWLLKVLFGRAVLKRILTQRRMKEGVFTPQKPLPAPGGDEAAAVARFRQVVDRFAKAADYQPSPFFGPMTPEQAREVQLIHCAHHLSFLVPKGA